MTVTQTPSVPLTKGQHPDGRRRRRPSEAPYRPGESRAPVRAQRLEALQDANALRVRKAEEKRAMAALTPPEGCRHAATALEVRAPWAFACTTAELLTAVHGLGRNVAREICAGADVGLGVRFDSLGERTDTALASIVAALRDRAAHGPQQRRPQPSGPTDPTQVSEALRRGNEIRVARGKLRAELLALGDPAGRERFCEILTTLTEHDPLASMRLYDALGYIPGFGALKIERVRDVTQIKGAFTLAGVARMRPSRRAWLLDVIGDPWAHEPPTPLDHQPRPAPSAEPASAWRSSRCARGSCTSTPARCSPGSPSSSRCCAAATAPRSPAHARRARSPGARWSVCACRSSAPTRRTACTRAGDSMSYRVERMYEGCYDVIDNDDGERVARVARFMPGDLVLVEGGADHQHRARAGDRGGDGRARRRARRAARRRTPQETPARPAHLRDSVDAAGRTATFSDPDHIVRDDGGDPRDPAAAPADEAARRDVRRRSAADRTSGAVVTVTAPQRTGGPSTTTTTATYKPRWGDLVAYAYDPLAVDEPVECTGYGHPDGMLIVGVDPRRTASGFRLVAARQHDGRIGRFSGEHLVLIERPPLPPALASEADLVNAFGRDASDVAPGRPLLPGDFYVAAYAVDRLCAGPQEGGQWYDAGRVVHASWIPRGTLLADALLNELREEWLRVWLRLRGAFTAPDRFNSIGGPDLEVSVTDTWPTDYPDSTPTYA